MERWRGRYSGPDQVALLRRVYDEWSPMWLGIEAGSAGLHTIQTLQRDLPVKELKPVGSKIARATTAATFMEQGKIWFLNKPWLDEWDTELASFPYAKHDGQVDVLSYAAQNLAKRERIRMTGWRLDPGLRQPSGFGP